MRHQLRLFGLFLLSLSAGTLVFVVVLWATAKAIVALFVMAMWALFAGIVSSVAGR